MKIVNEENEYVIRIPQKTNVPWRLLGGVNSCTSEQRKALKKEFLDSEKVVLKLRKLFALELPTVK